jgi:hypothetical protein
LEDFKNLWKRFNKIKTRMKKKLNEAPKPNSMGVAKRKHKGSFGGKI